MAEDGRRWYVARIKMSISWDTILQNLSRQGLEGYVPTIVQRTYYQGKKITIERPLFPTYGFVAFDRATTQWRGMQRLGVIHLLPINAEIPTPVPTEFVRQLKLRKTEAEMIETARQFAANDVVRFIAGPFMDAIDEDQRRALVVWSTPKRTRVAIKAAARGVIEATVPTDQLTPA